MLLDILGLVEHRNLGGMSGVYLLAGSLSGFTIAFVIHSVDRSLFGHLIYSHV